MSTNYSNNNDKGPYYWYNDMQLVFVVDIKILACGTTRIKRITQY